MRGDATESTPVSVAERLAADHRALDAVLADAKGLLRAGQVPRAAELFQAFRAGLERHMVVEEEILFPALERLDRAASSGPTGVMRTEHRDLRALLAEVASALEGSGSEGTVTPLAALTARIYAHNGKEERILYPMIDRALEGAAGREELLRRCEAALREGGA